jgi:ABC-type nitrate/sulfonate/bicarbonate transport system permease component
LIIFALPGVFFLGTTAIMFASCYHLLLTRVKLGLPGDSVWAYVTRETILQALFFSLIAELWFSSWIVFKFPSSENATILGIGIFTVIAVSLLVLHSFVRLGFDAAAMTRSNGIVTELNDNNLRSTSGAILLVCAWLVGWHVMGSWGAGFLQSSPLDAVTGAAYLFRSGEIWSNIGVSLLDLIGGMTLGSTMGLMAFLILAKRNSLARILQLILPLTYVSPMIVALLWINLLEVDLALKRMLLVSGLVFYPFVQALWGLRLYAPVPRILLAVDDALPYAFSGALLGEAYAATAGLGFVMVVASATAQNHYGYAAFFITVIFLVCFSIVLRWITRKCLAQAKQINSPTDKGAGDSGSGPDSRPSY